jgi:DNA-directed RNA polymerase specialized sigma24 family protein
MSSETGRTDGELLAAAAAGDGGAFAVFYRHLPAVVGFLLRETGDREASADLAAEVFAAVFLVARRYRPRGAGSARLWVRGITLNNCATVADRDASRTAHDAASGSSPKSWTTMTSPALRSLPAVRRARRVGSRGAAC